MIYRDVRRGSELSGLSNCGEGKSVGLCAVFFISEYYYFTAEEWTSFPLLPQSLGMELRTMYLCVPHLKQADNPWLDRCL